MHSYPALPSYIFTTPNSYLIQRTAKRLHNILHISH